MRKIHQNEFSAHSTSIHGANFSLLALQGLKMGHSGNEKTINIGDPFSKERESQSPLQKLDFLLLLA